MFECWNFLEATVFGVIDFFQGCNRHKVNDERGPHFRHTVGVVAVSFLFGWFCFVSLFLSLLFSFVF